MAKKDENMIVTKDGPKGPCSDCAYYRGNETPERHATGRCHGQPPNPVMPGGWVVVEGRMAGCAVFEARP